MKKIQVRTHFAASRLKIYPCGRLWTGEIHDTFPVRPFAWEDKNSAADKKIPNPNPFCHNRHEYIPLRAIVDLNRPCQINCRRLRNRMNIRAFNPV